MENKFTMVVEGQLPPGWSGNQLVDFLQSQLNEFGLKIIDVKTEGPGQTQENKSGKFEYLDWDNSRKAWEL